MKSHPLSVHTLCLGVLFTLGNSLLFSEQASDATAVFSLAAAGAAGLVSCLLVRPVVQWAVGPPAGRSRLSAFWQISVCLLFFAAVFYVGADCFREHLRFLTDNLLPRNARLALAAVFFLCVLVLAESENDAVLKFSLILLPVLLLLTLGLFFLSIRSFYPHALLPDSFSVTRMFKGIPPFLPTVFFPALCIPLYEAVTFQKTTGKSVWGVALGYLLLLFCFCHAVLLLGNGLAFTDFPYIEAISTLSLGSLYTRMDGFAYFTVFAVCLIRCGICVKLLLELCSRFGAGKRKLLTAGLCFFVCLFGYCL